MPPSSPPSRVAALRDGVHGGGLGLRRGPGGCRPSSCRTCSGSTPAPRAMASGGARARRLRPGAGHLQGAGRGPRGAASGPRAREPARAPGSRSRFRRPREPGHGPEAGLAPGGSRAFRRPAAGEAHPRGRRRPPDAALRAGHSRRGGLRPARDGRPPGAAEAARDGEKPQLVLLDLMLPGTDGIELMERVPELAELPVIFLSGYRRDETMARALELGAADYIVKPFSPPTELTARVQAALRRSAGADAFVLGDLAIEYERRRVTLAGRVVELTATEYELLRVLSVRAGRMTTHDTLLRQAWRKPGGDARQVRAVVKRGPAQAGRRRDAAHLHPHRAGRRLPHARTGRRGVEPSVARFVLRNAPGRASRQPPRAHANAVTCPRSRRRDATPSRPHGQPQRGERRRVEHEPPPLLVDPPVVSGDLCIFATVYSHGKPEQSTGPMVHVSVPVPLNCRCIGCSRAGCACRLRRDLLVAGPPDSFLDSIYEKESKFLNFCFDVFDLSLVVGAPAGRLQNQSCFQ